MIRGPSGSGKSILIKCVNGLEPFDRGALLVDGVYVGERASDMTRLRARMGMVFQHSNYIRISPSCRTSALRQYLY